VKLWIFAYILFYLKGIVCVYADIYNTALD
jgi:hypothetical protein